MKRTIPGLIFIVFLCTTTPAAKIVEKDFATLFNGYNGTIVVFDSMTHTYTVFNKQCSETRYTPFSTFKIPNSVIALATGVLTSVDTIFQWDTTKYPAEAWWPEQWKGLHTMRTAIKYSVVPFYRTIATDVGAQRMKEYLTRFKYGNVDISSGIDAFWLNGSLKISAMEQIDFLRKFYGNTLGVDKKIIDAVKGILLQKETDGYRLSAKTGGGNNIDNDPELYRGWYVGYVEKGKNVFFFALTIDGKDSPEIRNARIAITESVLRTLNIIE